MSPITTQVLDTALGTPAQGIVVVLEVPDGAHGWSALGRGTTGDDGRIAAFDPPVTALKPSVYRLRFATGDYFAANRVSSFYSEVHVVIRIDAPAQHYHVPLLLSPFGYSTHVSRQLRGVASAVVGTGRQCTLPGVGLYADENH